MKRRILGGTGMSVSEFALGAMMFGAMGNTDHDESVRDDPHGAGRRHQLRGHRGRLLAGRVGGDRRAGPAGPPRRRRAGDEVRPCPWAPTTTSAAGHPGGSSAPWRTACGGSAPTTSTSTRCTARTTPRTSVRPWRRSPTWSARARSGRSARSTFPAELIVEAQWAADRAGHAPLPHRAAARTRSSTGPSRASVLPVAQRYGMGVLTYGPLASGWLSGRPTRPRSHRRDAGAAGFRPGRPGQPGPAGGRPRSSPSSPPTRDFRSPTWPPRSSGPTRR